MFTILTILYYFGLLPLGKYATCASYPGSFDFSLRCRSSTLFRLLESFGNTNVTLQIVINFYKRLLVAAAEMARFYATIEKYFDDAGIENDVEKRITEAMIDVDSISKLMSEGTVDVEQAAMSLAYKFVYAYVKRHMDHWKDMHAIVGMVRDGKLFIDGYKCLDKYLAVVEVIKELSEGNEFVEDDTDEEEITELANNYMIKPTLH